METTIRETLKGLEIALEERKKKEQEIGEKDDSALIEEKRAELQKEMEDKLDAFTKEIEVAKDIEKSKLADEIETIEKLIGEFSAKLSEIEQPQDEQDKEESGEEDASVEEEKEEREEAEPVQAVNATFNPLFRR